MKLLLVTLYTLTVCQAAPDHFPGHHSHHSTNHHSSHHSQSHHFPSVHHSQFHSVPSHHEIHHSAPVHHAQVHQSAPVHHSTVHHSAPVHHAQVHHTAPVHHAQVHHSAPVHHAQVHHSAPVHHAQVLGDLVDVAVNAGTFTTLVKIVSDLGLADTIKGAQALTIFAPSDEAFAKLPAGTLESLTPEQAREIVLRHVVNAEVPASAVTTGPVYTFGGEIIELVKTNDGGVQINFEGNTVNVVAADIKASNGVIHVIDNVILPASLEQEPEVKVAPELGDVVDIAIAAGSFKTLVKIVSDLGLVDTLKAAEALTIFAPTDEAFARLHPGTLERLTPDQAKEIVLRHVVAAKVPASAVTTGPVETFGGEIIDVIKTAAGGVKINFGGNTVNVITADVEASNGVIHVIDNVILPRKLPAHHVQPAPKVSKSGDVVDVAIAAGSFKTLVKIVSDLGLVDTLKNAKILTIFAPSDDAFAKLPAGTLESLTPEQAKEIVLRHVVAAKIPSHVIINGHVKTLGGQRIGLIKTPSGGVQIQYNRGSLINVVSPDIQATNGIIHVIDNVIL